MSKHETKFLGGNVLSVEQEDRNGVPVGIVEGYIATWDIDRGDWTGVKDQFVRGAFVESILEHVQKRRPVRLKDHHGRTVGGFPIEFIKEDERGLYGIGEINLEVQQGREAYALAKQGVLSDFSIGFAVVDFEMNGDVRTIKKALIWEGSIVDEPMNPHANITQVKGIAPLRDIPALDAAYPWDEVKALARVKEFSDSEDAPSASFKDYFLFFDEAAPVTYEAYKGLVVDIVQGEPRVIPEAVTAAASAARTDPEAKAQVEQFCVKMNITSPYEQAGDDDLKYYSTEDVKDWTERDIEKALREGARFSKSAARAIMAKSIEPAAPTESDATQKILSELKALKDQFAS